VRYGRSVASDGSASSPQIGDTIDTSIVAELSVNARATLADLAAITGLSVSATQARVRRLEARGVITGYRAVVDAEAVGKPLAAFIEITPLDPGQPDNAPELIAHLDEIEACHSIAGDAAYMLFVRVASPRDLERLIRDIRAAASVNTRTTIVLQSFFEQRPITPA
jgi:Lrp/AsnC family transcriptional regulator, leucine-responsive regulatory protein